MTDPDDVLATTVDDLVDNFRSALLALLPSAARAQLEYRDGLQHPDWEHLAQCLFDVFVAHPFAVSRRRAPPTPFLARYDIDRDNYEDVSWITPDPVRTDRAVVRFLSLATPFDTYEFARLDPSTRVVIDRLTVPIDGAVLRIVSPTKQGPLEITDAVEAYE